MGEFYNGNNKEEDRRVKLADKVQEWWEKLDWDTKVDIYIDFNEKDEYMSADELYDGSVMSNFDNENERGEIDA